MKTYKRTTQMMKKKKKKLSKMKMQMESKHSKLKGKSTTF